MIGGLTASLAGVDRAQPDGALERFKFPANPTLMGPVQPADTRHEEQVQTPISVELARDGEGVLVVRRLPCPCKPSLKPLVHRHGLEVQQRQRGLRKARWMQRMASDIMIDLVPLARATVLHGKHRLPRSDTSTHAQGASRAKQTVQASTRANTTQHAP